MLDFFTKVCYNVNMGDVLHKKDRLSARLCYNRFAKYNSPPTPLKGDGNAAMFAVLFSFELRIVVFSDYNMVAFFAPRKGNMDNNSISPADAENNALRAEADKSLANAYEAVADFIKELKNES